MGQIMATPQCGDRLIVGTFVAGQVVMLDFSDRFNPQADIGSELRREHGAA